MPLWMLILLAAVVVKLPIAALMLWIPFRNDEAARAADLAEPSDEDGGSKALPGGPTNPHPRTPLPHLPRRGPHGSPSPSAPRRVRTVVASKRYLGISH